MADLIWPVGRSWRLLASLRGAALVLAALMSCAAYAAPTRAESLEARLLADAADGELDHHDFISAALIASGVADERELAQWEKAFAELRSAALPSSGGKSPGGTSLNDRLALIKAALHERVLIGEYVASASDLRTTIARGDYNCLTALAIYWDLCSRIGLSLDICSQPGHVNLRLAEGMEIEPSSDRSVTRLARGAGRQRVLTPVALLGKFYYNRGVEHLRAGRFAAGLALLETSLILDPADADARENLLAGLNNWAVEHCRQRRYDLATPLIERGLSIEPAFAPLVANQCLVREKLSK